ncbi:MAG: TlpA family protein disulfide reductase [Paludibacteraceae bacterium]|jgi:peroxiredoxin|nr:TlpA family protein disulfide reductase [Paludibacteraceae bacterium]
MKKILMMAMMVVAAVALHAQVPNVQLKNINGKTVQTASIANNGGKPVIISFWATWCKPCLRELKAIHEVYADWQDETGVKMYIVSIDQAQDANKVKPLVDGFGWEYEVLLDPNGDFKRAMNVQNVPHVFVINGKGKIVYNHAGYVDGGEEDIREALEK